MNWLPLPIFPEGALSASVIVTVWVGVFIVGMTNLRLGWVMSGLVIPGYMVPLLIAKPMAAVVTFAEGVVTYFLVWFYSEYLSRYTGWSNFFGRDRFFALVLASVGVRIVVDGWVLPELGDYLLQKYQYAFNYRNNLHSFGLIITALIANNFWKTGLWRGLWPMGVQVLLTWLIVRYVFMELTNFNISSLSFMYEDMATSFMATPKAYIILLVTAFIASRLNLFYGWDFSGILIPSLLALTWYEPIKIVTTMVEAIIILGLAHLVLTLPMFRNITMEGARKLLLFFNISFVYKFVLSWALVLFLPHLKISDWFGFGYLLATLIALKIHDKGIFARMTRATLQTSLTGLAVATVIGFVLLLLPDPKSHDAVADTNNPQPSIRHDARSIADVLYAEKTHFYAASLGQGMAIPLHRELDAFSSGVRLLLAYRQQQDVGILSDARRQLAAANYEVELVVNQYLLIREKTPQRHWGTYVIKLSTSSRLLIEVPAPVDEPASFEAGVALFSEFNALGFASAGAARRANDDGSSDVLTSPQSIFQAFHRELASREVLQIRQGAGGVSTLFTADSVPSGISLNTLQALTHNMQVQFLHRPGRNLQRQTMTGQFSELWLNPEDASRVQAQVKPHVAIRNEQVARGIDAELLAEITPQKVAQPGTRAYQAPTLEELLRIDRDVLTPMLRIAMEAGQSNTDPTVIVPRLSAIAGRADALGLSIRWITDAASNGYLLLHDKDNFRGWVLLRIGDATHAVIAVPRPLSEAGTLETAVSIFQGSKARAIVIAGAAPDTHPDGRADVLLPDNSSSLFNLAHQATLREMGNVPGVALLVRALALRAEQALPNDDAVLAFDVMYPNKASLPKPAAELVNSLEDQGLTIRLGAGQRDTAGLEALGGPLSSYVVQTQNKRFGVLWLSPVTRRQVDAQALHAQERQFAALGIASRKSSITAEIAQRPFSKVRLPDTLRKLAEQYRTSNDIVLLSTLRHQLHPVRMERIDDAGGRGAYLLFLDTENRLAAVLALSSQLGSGGNQLQVPTGSVSAENINQFVTGRLAWMVTQ